MESAFRAKTGPAGPNECVARGRRRLLDFLKGVAWIDQQNYQIVHLETDILKPVPAVRLTIEHQVLDCGPVQFEQKKLKLWLPLEAEIYLDVNGKHFHHRHI